MEEQEWKRSARRHAPLRTNQATNGATSPRGTNLNARLSAHTVASSNKSVQRKNEPREPPNDIKGPSRWKEMRQAVRIKATIDTDERRSQNARIADLCEEDRDKVAKLVRRIVEVSSLHEQSEHEFQRQRAEMEREIQELRGHVKRDSSEIDELSDKLKAALEKLRDYQERVLVLEESNELEVRHRLETDQTVDLLKLEVDKLRKLVKKQKQEMESNEREQQRKHREEMEHMTQQLSETHEQLLRERRERLEEKQKELEDRLQRSATSQAATVSNEAVAVETNKYDPPSAAIPSNGGPAGRGTLPLDMSSFLNTSTDLPDKIKEIMNEWKARMEDALNTTAASIKQNGPTPHTPRTVSTGIQTELQERPSRHGGNVEGERRRDISPRRSTLDHQVRRKPDFDRLLVEDNRGSHQIGTQSARSREGSHSPASRSSSPPRNNPRAPLQTRHPSMTPPAHERSITRALVDDFANASALVDDDSFEEEVESTIALIDGLQSPPHRTPEQAEHYRTPRRKLSLYDSSMLDVVDKIENDSSRIPSYLLEAQISEQESPTLRVERMLAGLRIREQKLARASSRAASSRAEPSFLHDVELFNELKDVYEEHLHERHREALQPHEDEYDHYDDACDISDRAMDPASPVYSDRCLTVQESIERDMQELLQQEGFPAH